MADGEGEDDEDFGAPPNDPKLRVWTDPNHQDPPTAEERARFGIPDTVRIALAPATPENATSANNAIVVALVAKLPQFDPNWPAKTQAAWLKALDRIAGLK